MFVRTATISSLLSGWGRVGRGDEQQHEGGVGDRSGMQQRQLSKIRSGNAKEEAKERGSFLYPKLEDDDNVFVTGSYRDAFRRLTEEKKH